MFEKKINLLLDKIDLIGNEQYKNLRELAWKFSVANKDVYLVGGCVRDLLLNRKPKDYDFCTPLKPEEVKHLFKNQKPVDGEYRYEFLDTGLKHGTITIYDKPYKTGYEVTTYRVDGKYEDGRHPTEVTFTPNLEEDLKRRDFTINSFAYDIKNQKLIMLDESYLRDLEYGIIRTVGNPIDRFNEDALRMLRALRFMAQLNFSIEENTYSAIKALNSKLSMISKERIRDELTKMLMSDTPQVLELVIESGLETYMFAGLTPLTNMLRCEHQNPWHYTDVFHHTMDVVKRVPKTFELRWAALFHDTGKPATKTLKEGTTDYYNYHGHQEVSVEIATKIMDILKFSNDSKDLILKYVKYHDTDLVECKNSKFKQVVADIGVDNFPGLIKLKASDSAAHNITRDTKWSISYISKLYDRFSKVVIEDQALKVTDLAINGYDVGADGFLKGKEIGDCLKWMLEIVLEHPEYNTREKLLELLQMFKEMSFQST